MNKFDKLIMVVKRQVLLADDHFDGFKPKDDIDFESRILKHHRYMKRGLAEHDPGHKQPIAYIIIVNPQTKKVFAYQRASHDSQYSEKRLQGKWSWGLGGHIDKIDGADDNPIRASMRRELAEEAEVTVDALRVLGYINSDTDDVGKVHFGILYVIETRQGAVMPKAPEIDHGTFMSIDELQVLCATADVEDWSRIALGPLISYLG
ncbi:MAG: NUDIX domain-containing protein [Candidatus Aenigmarchaeota archaeon]|nr:NUDIX domain-containing protein [Candidatus Aenigmarchaeota archaeon]